MTTKDEALKLALESLKELVADPECDFGPSYELQEKRQKKAIAAIREALAEQPAPYPEGDVVGPCICGSWPGGKCLKCQRIEQPAQQQDANDRFMTVVYRNVQEDDAKSFTEHPKAVWFGWCHAPYQRDEARYKLEKVSASPPASKPWAGITDEEVDNLWGLWLTTKHGAVTRTEGRMFARVIEAKLREKNAS